MNLSSKHSNESNEGQDVNHYEKSNLASGDSFQKYDHVKNVRQTLDQHQLANKEPDGQATHYPLGFLFMAAKCLYFTD